MEARGNVVFAASNKRVFDEPPAICFVEGYGATVNHRIAQTTIAGMFSDDYFPITKGVTSEIDICSSSSIVSVE
jgi:hypothetical protein